MMDISIFDDPFITGTDYTEFLSHVGTPHAGSVPHSGRYPWGSGDNAYQRYASFIGDVQKLRKQGLSEKEIADGYGISVRTLRARKTVAKDEIIKAEQAQVTRMRDRGMSTTAIAEKLGIPESTVRTRLDAGQQQRRSVTAVTADMLRDELKKDGYLDIGAGTEQWVGVSKEKLAAAVEILKDEGYNVYSLKVRQLGTGKETTIKTLARPEDTFGMVSKNRDKIHIPGERSEDGGETYEQIERPRSVDSSRIFIRYAEDGGTDKDGVIELRRGVEDISLKDARYAQVRIAVDDSHYLKGMAMYSDNIPDGYDIVFNTNKHKGTPMLVPDDPKAKQVLKPMKSIEENPENPFGASIRLDNELKLAQRHYIDENGERQLSCLNIVSEEGNWDSWSNSLSSQMLSKQTPSLAKKQLDISYGLAKDEFDSIMSYTNPTVKKELLISFADQCDSDAAHLRAAGLPRQAYKVILPFPEMKENEIYAPGYRDGEKVVLIRYPHGGIFEIPELTVNNRDPQANKLIPNAKDAVGIHPKVAERLSGADFDGDTVLVIPNNDHKIKTAPALKGLKDFDPKEEYPYYEGMKVISPEHKQKQMGVVTNLIMDMTIQNAPPDDICKAVRHSMVVIDAEKHKLDWKRSEKENDIQALKKKYQKHADDDGYGGASTIITRAKSEARIPERQEGQVYIDPETGRTRRRYIDPETGEKLYSETGRTNTITRINSKGQVIQKIEPRITKVHRMDLVKDARELSSGYLIEEVYASHANRLKSLANEARKASLSTKEVEYNPSAARAYDQEVKSLNAKLARAEMNSPLERKAQLLGNKIYYARLKDNPDMSKADQKKYKGRALTDARNRLGAKKETVRFEGREWEAVQAGAITKTKLKRILRNADEAQVKELSLPRTSKGLTSGQKARAQSMLANGYTQAQVADAIGVSVSTLNKNL